jgi:hypothetical protein
MVNHRIYKLVDKYIILWIPLAVLLLIIGSGVLVSVHLDYNPNYEREIISSEFDSFNMNSDVSSVATNNTTLFNKSDIISGPVYINGTNPNLTITQNYNSDRETQVETKIWLIINGSEQGWSFWKESYMVEKEQIEFKDSYTYQTTFSVEKFRQRALNIREVFNERGTIKVDMIIENEYATDIYSGKFNKSSRFVFRTETYSVLPPKHSYSNSHPYEIVEETIEYGDQKFIQGGLIIIAGGFFMLFIRFVIADPTRRRKDYVLARFSDWISYADAKGTNIRGDDNVVKLSSCEDIIDVGADNKKRVIYIESEDVLLIQDDGVVYEYEFTDWYEKKERFQILGSNKKDSSNNDSDSNESENDENGSFSFT